MRPIRSATLATLTSVALAASLAGCQFSEAEQNSGSELLIAADLELSGAAAQVGQAYQRALELKVEQINQSGALGDRQLRLVVRDNRSDPSQSLRNIGDFTDDPAVSAIIMGSCSDCAIGAAKTVNDKEVPTIALASAAAVASPAAERRYMFKLAPNATDTAAALAPELKRAKVKKIGLLHTADAYGREGLDALTKELNKINIRVARSQAVKATDTDVSQAMASLTLGKPDAVVVWTTAEQAVLATRGAREANYAGKLYLDAAAAGELFLEDAGPDSAGSVNLVFTQTMVIDDVIATNPAKAARKQWFRDYTARFGDYYGFSSFAADAVQLIVNAATRSGTDRDGLRSLLETSQMDGLSGPIRMTPGNHSGLTPQALTMLVARGGRWRLAG